MDFIYCEKCFPPCHHDRHVHTGQRDSASEANSNVKAAWLSRGGFPGPAGTPRAPEAWPRRTRKDRARLALLSSTGADALGDQSPADEKSDPQTAENDD